MAEVSQFVDTVDGVRNGVADAIAARFDSVADIAAAEPADLQEVRGVGPVLAERIVLAARAEATTSATATVAADTATPAAEPTRDRVAPSDLPPVFERLALLVGTTLGWTLRAYRSVALPVSRLLHRGARSA